MNDVQRVAPGRLAGRTAVVIGAGSSIGTASVRLFAKHGAHVLAVDPDANVASEVCAAVARDEVPGTSRPWVADLTGDAANELAAECDSSWGHLDVLFVCSAAMDWWPLGVDSTDRWDEVIRTNLLGPAAFARALLPLINRSRSGSVIFLGSIDGIRGNANLPAYSISKGGLIPLTHVLADQYGPSGIRVNCVATGAIHQTGPSAPPIERVTAHSEMLLRLTPLRRRATPDDVAFVALFLASDDASYVTGAVLPVDGGRLAATPGTNLVELP